MTATGTRELFLRELLGITVAQELTIPIPLSLTFLGADKKKNTTPPLTGRSKTLNRTQAWFFQNESCSPRATKLRSQLHTWLPLKSSKRSSSKSFPDGSAASPYALILQAACSNRLQASCVPEMVSQLQGKHRMGEVAGELEAENVPTSFISCQCSTKTNTEHLSLTR